MHLLCIGISCFVCAICHMVLCRGWGSCVCPQEGGAMEREEIAFGQWMGPLQMDPSVPPQCRHWLKDGKVWFPIVSLSPTSGTSILFCINSESFGIIPCTIILSPALVLPLLTHVIWWEERRTLEAGVGSPPLANSSSPYGPHFCSLLNKGIQEEKKFFLGEGRRSNVYRPWLFCL